MNKLYIIVRSDLEEGLQLAQSCHALQAMNDQHPETIRKWQGNIVCLAARDAKHLSELLCDLGRRGYTISSFCEPDVGGELTAVAVEGRAWRQLSNLPLALRRPLARVA